MPPSEVLWSRNHNLDRERLEELVAAGQFRTVSLNQPRVGPFRNAGLTGEEVELIGLADAIMRRTKELQLEAELGGPSTEEAEKRRAVLVLEPHLPITAARREEIERLTEGYGRRSRNLEEVTRQQPVQGVVLPLSIAICLIPIKKNRRLKSSIG